MLYNSYIPGFQPIETPHCISLLYFCHIVWFFEIYVLLFYKKNLSSKPKVYWNMFFQKIFFIYFFSFSEILKFPGTISFSGYGKY